MLLYYCQKCGASMKFGTFLKDFDSNLYKQFALEMFKNKNTIEPNREYEYKIPETKKYIPDIFSDLPLVRDLDENSDVYQFCQNRKLPINTFDFKFAENFINWTKGNTDKFKNWRGEDHPRLIIPWYDRQHKIIGYSARALDSLQEQKYYRIFVDETAKEHFFGLDRVDDSVEHYILEGEIDSLMIPNAIAVSNGKLHTYKHTNAVYIPDSDTRNKHIMKNVSDMIELGLQVCMLPTYLPKDLNEVVQSGLSQNEIMKIIKDNTFQGLSAMMHFLKWRVV
jgi:hypothetical protein